MTRPLVEKGRVALLAVDEAHSISEWGGEFRPLQCAGTNDVGGSNGGHRTSSTPQESKILTF